MGKIQVVLFLGLTVTLMAIGQAEAAAFFVENATHPDYPGACYYDEGGISIEPNEKVQLAGECALLTCYADLSLSYYSCGVSPVSMPFCVKTGRDLSKPYPECCNEFTCKGENGTA